jgi:ribosome-binding protein aMBF1 (putative translation factor)
MTDARDDGPLLVTERTSVRERQTLSPEVAAMLRAAHRRQGWSAKAVAEQAGISASHVWSLESGRRAPSQAVARALLVILDLSLDEAEALVAEAQPDVGWSRW